MITIGPKRINNEFWRFDVWAPNAHSVQLQAQTREENIHDMNRATNGYWHVNIPASDHELEYLYIIDGRKYPDPASHFQPDGVHGPSQTINHDLFEWSDLTWKNHSIKEYIIYELHCGTFTDEGTLEAIIQRLDDLKELGINAIEIMPLAQFPGYRNWGYDGVNLFAVQNTYGGPEQLKKLVNACHNKQIAVILDVVYNHLGPEGNYLENFAPYFTQKYTTFWGKAVNLDDAWSDEVRSYFIQNALYWFHHFHIDALRLDAIHAFFDMSAYPFLQELGDAVKTYNNKNESQKYLIAESGLNDSKIIRDTKNYGFGIDAQWSDDFHHSVHTLITGEKDGYYSDYGKLNHLKKVLSENFTYSGQYSNFRKRQFGNDASYLPHHKFVICIQNHDQTGNRKLGDRLSVLTGFEELKLAAGIMLMSPFIPMLFMGEEYGEVNPFLYFIDHSDPDLIEAVRKGRKSEFSDFNWDGDVPDPYQIQTYKKSKLEWHKRKQGKNNILLGFYKYMTGLRKNELALLFNEHTSFKVETFGNNILFVECTLNNLTILSFCNFDNESKTVNLPHQGVQYQKLIYSAEKKWNGPEQNLSSPISSGEIKISAKSIIILKTPINDE